MSSISVERLVSVDAKLKCGQGVGAKPVPDLCLIVKRRERRFPEPEEV